MFEHKVDAETELLLLDERQADELYALVDRHRAHLRQWLPWVDGTTSVQSSRVFIREALKQFADTQGFHAGIWEKGRLAGVIGFHKIDWANRRVMIGYWLAPPFQGRGIMTRACRAMVDHAFGHLKLNRVEIHCAVENLKSRAIPERLGFAQEGTLRQGEFLYDHYVDLVVYAMLSEDWARAREAGRPNENLPSHTRHAKGARS